MMKPVKASDLSIHRLYDSDIEDVKAHFMRLDMKNRRLRFGNPVNDGFLEQYAETILKSVSLVQGAYVDGVLRGVGEIRGLPTNWTKSAEAALSVEEDWQNMGIGGALLKRLVATAQNRGISQIYMMCLKENTKMQHLATKHEAILDYDIDQSEGRINTKWPTIGSVYEEMSAEAEHFVKALWTNG